MSSTNKNRGRGWWILWNNKTFLFLLLGRVINNTINCIQTKTPGKQNNMQHSNFSNKVIGNKIAEAEVLKTSFILAVSRQSICQSNLTNLCICFRKSLGKYTGNALYRNFQTKEAVTQLQSQGCLTSYEAAFRLRFVKRVFYLFYKNFFKKLFLRLS